MSQPQATTTNGDGDSPKFVEPEAWDSEAIFNDADDAEFPDVGIFVLPSGEGERVGFRNIRSEREAIEAIRQMLENAYLAARHEFGTTPKPNTEPHPRLRP